MPVEILNQKFFNQFKNDTDFTANTGDFTNNLAGSVMENIQYNYEVEIEWFSNASQSNAWNIIGGNKIVQTSGNFRLDGFSAGDECDFIAGFSTTPVVEVNITVDSISEDGKTMVFTINSGAFTDTFYLDAGVRGLTPLTALKYKFGLVGNSENFNIESKVSENDQGYYGANIGFDTGGGARDTNFVDLLVTGQYQDWKTGSMKVRYVNNPTTYVQRFEVEHEFMIVPYYLDGELSNLQNNIIPDLLNGLNSLKYVFSPGFRTVLSNPNTEKATTVTNNLGSVAWFNESFNGFQNDYNIVSVAYEDAATTDSADGILVGTKTKVTITVERLSGVFAGAERFGAYVSYLPEQNEYQDTTATNLKDNFIYDNALNNAGLVGVAGQDFITDLTATIVGGELVIVMELEYSSMQKAFLSNKISQSPTNFVIGVQVGDATLPSGNSDRVVLIADVNEYDESADIPGLMEFTKFDIYPHDRQISFGVASTDMTSWNEDGLVIDFEFDLDLFKSAFLNSLDFKLIAFNTLTQQYFELDSFSYSVANAIVSNGIQQINETTTRGYILKAGDQFNEVTIVREPQIFTNLQPYSGRFAQKISWQDWIQNLAVDTIFYDNSEPNDNLNNKASNYSLLNDYEIRLSVLANLDGVNQFGVAGNTNYLFNSPNITVYDYTLDGLVTPIWSHVIETFNNATMANLSGAVLTGQDTLLRATWTNSGGPVTSLVDLWGVNRIEETGQLGYEITEMSSVNDPLTNQLLIPSSGTKLFMYLNAGLVVMECLIDGSKVVPGINYNLSSRIQDENAVVVGKLTSPTNEVKDTSGTVETKIETP